MASISWVGLCYLCCLLVILAESTRLDYFRGRSGSIVVQPQEVTKDDSIIFLEGSPFESMDLTQLDDLEFADLLSHVSGLQPFNSFSPRLGFPSGDLFGKPHANVLFSIDSVGSDILALHPDLHLWESGKHVRLVNNGYPRSTVTTMTTLLTGTTPEVHGIVAPSWRAADGSRVFAFSQRGGQRLAASIADVWTQTFRGSSLVVSSSSSSQLAKAGGLHEQIATSFPEGSQFVYSWLQSRFEEQNERESPLALDKVQLENCLGSSSFSKMVLPDGASSFYLNGQLTITFANYTAVFNMNEEEDLQLLAELAFVYNLIENMRPAMPFSSLVRDSIPDLLSISFSSLQRLKEKYGAQSPKFVGALYLVDNTIDHAFGALQELYSGKVAAEILCLNSNLGLDNDAKRLVYQTVRSHLHSGSEWADFEQDLPHIYMPTYRALRCGALQAAVVGTRVHAICQEPTELYSQIDATITTNTTTTNDVAAFHILLWGSIVLVLAVLAGVLVMFSVGVDMTKDTLLFRSTGRHPHSQS